MKKTRIMHIVQAAGGVEKYLKMLIKYTNQNEFENILVCSFDYSADEFSELAVDVERVEMCRSINPFIDLIGIIKVRKLINKYSPDVVYMHSSKAGAIGRLANIGNGNLSIYNPHGWAFNMDCSDSKRNVYRLIEKKLAYFVTRIVTISEREKMSALDNLICNESKLEVIVNGVDIEEYYRSNKSESITRADLGIPSDAMVFGCVGRLANQKAPDVFVKFAQKMKAAVPNAYFLMIGDGELRTEVEDMVEKYDLLDSFQITGWVDEPMQYIELFDQAFLLSRWEGFGLVLAEYMLAGIPIIATEVDAIPFVVTNQHDGILVQKNDPEAVFQASLSIYESTTLKYDLIENGKRTVHEKFDARRVANETAQLIEEVLQ